MKVKKDFICICKQETFSPVSSINTDAIPDYIEFWTFIINYIYFLFFYVRLSYFYFLEFVNE